jgi:2-iminoacetate synthase
MTTHPPWLDPAPWVRMARVAGETEVLSAVHSPSPGLRELAALLSPAAADHLESMAQRALAVTRRHFGRTISLYVPLYLSNFCVGGCAYCGYASDRDVERRRLERKELLAEILDLKGRGFEDVLLLTGERTPEADFDYLRNGVKLAAEHLHNVTVESFAMATDEYRTLGEAGATGITLYQETYDPALYARLHRWGPKRDYGFRLEAPARALEAGLRTVGVGVLLGLSDPLSDTVALYQHITYLRKRFWQAGILVSFPRICRQLGGFDPDFEVDERLLARMIFAFRICLPDVPLVLSTRESAGFRDGIAGLGINRMSVASRTTVGGYHDEATREGGQFDVRDTRDVTAFCAMLNAKGLEPVFKNWHSVFRERPAVLQRA